jgi:hypothetical protein
MTFTIIGVTRPTFFGLELGRSFDIAMPIGGQSILNGRNTLLDQRAAP